VAEHADGPRPQATSSNGNAAPPGFEAWARTNVYRQRQAGYAVATVTLPLGDMTPAQARALSDLGRRFAGESMRLTVDQNIVMRWVREQDLAPLYAGLVAAKLGQPGAQSIIDITACPGTDTCKLGISSSRGLAGELRRRLVTAEPTLDGAVRELKVKISGCFNSCGQHHVADIGFYGVTRKKGGYNVPFFQLILGGQWHGNAGAYGLAAAAIPSKAVPKALERLTANFVRDRQDDETFQAYVRRVGKAQVRAAIEDLLEVPDHDADASYYADWADTREYTTGDMGIGECAGEVVSSLEFGLAAAEREAFEAQIALEEKQDPRGAAELALRAMLTAARELVRTEWQDVPADTATVVAEFRRRFCDTGLFHDPFVGVKFANFLFQAVETPLPDYSASRVHQRIEETLLFIEAAYACSQRLGTPRAATGG